MKDITIEGSHEGYFIPTVNFSYEKGVCEIAGESFLEETNKFYSPLIEWIDEYISHKPEITFNCKLSYFNTSSTKSLLDIFKTLKRFENNGGKVKVNWYFEKDDFDLKEAIEDYIIDTGLRINMIDY